jgi:small-conductance mechanosensitive channel
VTGTIAGKYPISPWKVLLAVLLAVVALLVVMWIGN